MKRFLKQKALWLAHQIDEKTGLYHEPVSIQIEGVLDVQQLEKALQYIVNKHAALQLHVRNSSKGPKQIIQEDVQVEMPCYDWSAYREEEKVGCFCPSPRKGGIRKKQVS
ncbi:condensation domain-containing protein [Bacillus cereus]|uniref:condensation domain-containing protein n=1 Tax=Bacillus TaxID=1386 RepID=UPI0024BA7712|nr:condensation domain-containing protein [Bacillus cereus]WHS75953.1 condensation domain-containing protein [Bacillus cereus]